MEIRNLGRDRRSSGGAGIRPLHPQPVTERLIPAYPTEIHEKNLTGEQNANRSISLDLHHPQGQISNAGVAVRLTD